MILLRLSPGHSACCVQNLAAAAALVIARSPAASVATVCATPLYQTWRKGSFERRSANEPHSWHTPSMNARSATYVTSASEGAPSAIIFAESWGWAVPARIASSRSCSAISWTWRSSPDRNPWHRSDPQELRAREGHDALFAQGLDNPLWVAHMPHQPATTTTVSITSLSNSFPRPRRSSKQRLRLSALLRSMLLPRSTSSGNSSPRRRQI
jgi:hypothetical protein